MAAKERARSATKLVLDMTTAVVMVIVVGLLIATIAYAPGFFAKRAVRKVVSRFRRKGALDPATATTMEELGLIEGGLMDRMFKPRDYRPLAARLLLQAGVIRATDDGGVYLSEEELDRSRFKKHTKPR
jgi:hypothetical protein